MGSIRALLTVLCCGGLLAQEPAPQPAPDPELARDVTARLQAAEPAEVARGAHLAAEHKLTALGPELRAALAKWKDGKAVEDRAVRMQLIDTMWQLQTRPPREEIEFLLADQHTWVPAFLILAQQHADQDWLLAIATADAARTASTRQAARSIAMMLVLKAGKPEPTAARYLIEHAHHLLTITVTDGQDGQWDSLVGLGGRVMARAQPLRGFPPHPHHSLLAPGERGPARAPVVAEHRNVAWRHVRTLKPHLDPNGTPTDTRVADLDVGTCRDWLAGIAGLEGTKQPDVRWNGETDLRAEVQKHQVQFRAWLENLNAALLKKGWIEPRDFRRIPFVTELVDMRGDQSQPLPQIEQEPGGR